MKADELMRVGEGQRAQQEGIDYSEDRNICADGERENQSGNNLKPASRRRVRRVKRKSRTVSAQ